MNFFRYLGLILWTILTVIPWFFVVLFRFKDPSLFKDYLALYAPVACKILGIRVSLEGLTREQIATHQPCVLVGNHQSGIDVLSYSYLQLERTVTVGKKEILWVPFFGWIYWATGNILIDRSKSRNAIATLTAVAREIKSRNLTIAMFPEGTRNRTYGPMLPFKKGAFHIAITAQVPIIPLACSSLAHLFDDRGRFKGGNVVMRVLAPVPTLGLGSSDVDRLSADVRSKMETAINEVTEKAKKVLGTFLLMALSGGFLLSGAGCAGSPKNTFTLTEFWAAPIRVRRPEYAPSDPKAGPGGVDYQSTPAPDKSYNCEEPRSLLSKLDFSVVTACLRKIQTEGTVEESKKVKYFLELGPQPTLKLDEDPEKPTCLRSALPEIPVPREIFFHALREEQVSCFSSRLNIEQGETLGIRFSSKGSTLVLKFPLEKFPKDFSELERQILAWSFTPLFIYDGEPTLEATVVPEALCQRCFGQKFQRPKQNPPTWPKETLPSEVAPEGESSE
jgi:1-acyl-sn-glycerol-3-phosphate acyltransferase